MQFSYEAQWFPFQPSVSVDLELADNTRIESGGELPVKLTGKLDNSASHVWLVTHDEAANWYPLAEAFPKAGTRGWTALLRRTQFDPKPGKTDLHALVTNDAASNAFYADLQRPGGIPKGLPSLPEGARSIDHATLDLR
jgi:hypothetical protein